MGTAVRKVRGGKLLRVKLEHDAGMITAIAITGDFFLYPEDGLEVLERGLVGLPLSDDVDMIAVRIEALLSAGPITPLGFNANDLAEAITEARH